MKKLIDTLNLVETKRNFILDEESVLPAVPLHVPAAVTAKATTTTTSKMSEKAVSVSSVSATSAGDSKTSYGIQLYDPAIYTKLSVSNGYSIVKLPNTGM